MLLSGYRIPFTFLDTVPEEANDDPYAHLQQDAEDDVVLED